jgi:hypothetical protein
MNAVDAQHNGIASSIDDAVATIASLLAVAIFGVVALQIAGGALDRHRRAPHWQTPKALSSPSRCWPLHSADREIAAALIRQSLATDIRDALLLTAGLALAGAFCAADMIKPKPEHSPVSDAQTSRIN